MKLTIIIVSVLGVLFGLYFLVSKAGEEEEAIVTQNRVSQVSAINGRSLYEENCASCHSVNGRGTENGPPFLHKVYESSHHSDAAFLRAPKQGVRAHHWKFGDMPPIPGLDDEEIVAITAYIRQMQRMVGIK
ncbi:c-type cytochrome [Sneathiella glossodoripedis]|uniref:c-type cytochrome n=1 Tax=Sneathiella glossodoripedis TaxID=418853 RepID=UPI00046E9A95|nr:cytochrome c [Sneathiella glossodoripedis]